MDAFFVISQQSGIPVPLTDAALRALMSGARLEGVVIAQGNARSIMLANAIKIPLPENIALSPGQRVTVEMTAGPQGSQIRIVPQSTVQSTPAPGAGNTGVLLSIGPSGDALPAAREVPFSPGPTASEGSTRPPSVPLNARSVPSPSEKEMRPTALAGDKPGIQSVLPEPPPHISNKVIAQVQEKNIPSPSNSPAHGTALKKNDVPIIQMIRQILRALAPDRLSDADRLVSLVPSRVASNHSAVRSLMALFLSRHELGDQIRELSLLLREAEQQGWIPSREATLLLALYGDKSETYLEPEKLISILKNSHGSDPAEKILAAVLKGHMNIQDALDQLRITARQLLAVLRDNRDLAVWAENSGRKQQLDNLLTQLLDRNDAAVLQHLHGDRIPYRFLDLSGFLLPGLTHGMVHWISDGQKRSGTEDNHLTDAQLTVEMDLSFSRLGDIWVTMTAKSGAGTKSCFCRLRCADENVCSFLSRNIEPLREGLRSVGYEHAAVSVETWQGDRLSETVRVLRPLRPISLNG